MDIKSSSISFLSAACDCFCKDFNIDLAGSSTGTLYGRGAYLGESITKAAIDGSGSLTFEQNEVSRLKADIVAPCHPAKPSKWEADEYAKDEPGGYYVAWLW